jgi:hypothetical protein
MIQPVEFVREDVEKSLNAYKFNFFHPLLTDFRLEPEKVASDNPEGTRGGVSYIEKTFRADIVLNLPNAVRKDDLTDFLDSGLSQVASCLANEFGVPFVAERFWIRDNCWCFGALSNNKTSTSIACVKYPVLEPVSLEVTDPDLKNLEFSTDVRFATKPVEILKEKGYLVTQLFPTFDIYVAIKDGRVHPQSYFSYPRNELKTIDFRFR